MEILICISSKGKPIVEVKGSSHNTPKQVAKAYKETLAELQKEDK